MNVLVIDDEKNIRESIQRYLSLDAIESRTCASAAEGQQALAESRFDAIVLDLRMPEMTGLELLEWLREQGPDIPVIMISAYGEVTDAVAAMKLGAADYVVKPFDPAELSVRLRRVIESSAARNLLEARQRTTFDFGDVIGESVPMKKIKALIERVGPTPSNVLITGESGTGKEVIARALHRSSSRAAGPFTAVNLGGIPEALIESELFGYERGAFTGAAQRKHGLFELASGGTLFLDEIGDLAAPMQVKLLRVLQDRKLQRLGGTQLIPIDARIVAATNRNLEAGVRDGLFREDLFYRLNVVRIEVPPLSKRRDDIPLLARHVVDRLSRRLGRRIVAIDDGAMAKLKAWQYPGNVRELENILERAIIFSEGGRLTAADIDLPVTVDEAAEAGAGDRDENAGVGGTDGAPGGGAGLGEDRGSGTLREMERSMIIETLERHDGNRTKASAELGISRRTLFNKLREYGIE